MAAKKATTKKATTTKKAATTKGSSSRPAARKAAAATGAADPIARMRAMLDDPSTDVFLFGVRMMLGQSRRPELRDHVVACRVRIASIAAATDASPEQRAAAAAALSALGFPSPPPGPRDASVVTRLLKKAASADGHQRAEAIEALAAHDDPRIAPVVLAALGDARRLVRKEALRTAGRLRLAGALPRLVAQSDSDVGALLAQVEGLRAFGGPEAEAALASEALFARVCRQLTWDQGVAAVKALACLCTPAIERRLAEVVVGLDPDVVDGRHDSLGLLIKRGHPDAVAPLIGGVLDADRDPELRAELLWAARAVAATTPPTPAATAALRSLVVARGADLPALASMRAEARDPLGAPAVAWQEALAGQDERLAALLFG